MSETSFTSPEPPKSFRPPSATDTSDQEFDLIIRENLAHAERSSNQNPTDNISIEEASYEERIRLYEEKLQLMAGGLEYWKQKEITLVCSNRILEGSNRDPRQNF
ncbi:hypothetical protein K3495_g838 [Podosphaera aphanis]|nr:hypothetical protein K3495_g838 [Podosphaera aphanis]